MHTAVWTGTEMIVWGGNNPSGYLNTGSRYNPVTDTWTPTTKKNAPKGRADHTAVWAVWADFPSDVRMIVWGGGYGTGTYLNTGGSYVP